MYDVSVSTIYRAIEAGQLDAYRIGTGKGAIRIPEHALVVFEEECAIEPQDVASDPEIRAGATQAAIDAQAGEVA
jgi:excisionase family DNA binding protein